ncbi:hypothetical protein GW758_00855 [Candidatus Falkowbacteria bacterium]|nr:hypothetical protein [Candidatus Falkowbacteria bacterium]
MEAEFIGSVNKKKYDELAFDYIQQKTKQLVDDDITDDTSAESKEEKYEKILKMREAAASRFDSLVKIQKDENLINYEDSMNLVEKSQYGSPEKPAKFFSASLYNYIKNRFEDKYSLKFYTATGLTHLDILHGIDCFFKLCDKETDEEIIGTTIDLTGNRDKTRAKANIIILISQEERDQMDPSKVNKDFNKETFQAKIDEYGEKIVQSILTNYQNKLLEQEKIKN